MNTDTVPYSEARNLFMYLRRHIKSVHWLMDRKPDVTWVEVTDMLQYQLLVCELVRLGIKMEVTPSANSVLEIWEKL